jgi:hypothetical protein
MLLPTQNLGLSICVQNKQDGTGKEAEQMVRDGSKSDVLIDLGALPTHQNKGFKSLTDQGVATPMLFLRKNTALSSLHSFLSRQILMRRQPKKSVRHVSDEITASERNAALVRMNWGHFALDERDPKIKHSLAYIERNAVRPTLSEREAGQELGRIETFGSETSR